MPLYDACVPQMTKMLRNLDGWLEQAVAYAEERGFDPERLLVARLAPDMFTLTQQIQSACDSAKFAACRLSGTEAPKHADDESTIGELRARIASTVEVLEGIGRESFDAAADRELSLSFLEGRKIRGADYFDGFAQPNFHFHLSMAYAILRHNGVPLGKRTFIGGLTLI